MTVTVNPMQPPEYTQPATEGSDDPSLARPTNSPGRHAAEVPVSAEPFEEPIAHPDEGRHLDDRPLLTYEEVMAKLEKDNTVARRLGRRISGVFGFHRDFRRNPYEIRKVERAMYMGSAVVGGTALVVLAGIRFHDALQDVGINLPLGR